jgi:hypothetical protein
MTDQDKDSQKPAGPKGRMAPLKEAPPGLEQDGSGNVIPFEQRTKEDQDMARAGRKEPPARK